MGITKDQAKSLLKERSLRVTAPRLAVIQVLADAESPLSHTEVLERLGDTDWDPATIYRNLIKLREADLATIVSRAEGITRYALSGAHGDEHQHPHFICEDCGKVSCLPISLSPKTAITGPWADSVRSAVIQFRGECPDCRKSANEAMT